MRKRFYEWWHDVLQSAHDERFHRISGPCGPREEGCKTCYGGTWKKAPITWLVAVELADRLRMWTWRKIFHCKHPARRFHCEDWGGPDSGGMGGTCSRCGWSFKHVLY